MSDEELSPQPTPESRKPEKFPGGADNLADEEKYGDRGGNLLGGPAVRDLDPSKNPAVEEAAPAEVGEREDKRQEGEENTEDREAGSEDETPEAGQEDEKGNPEEPA